MTFVLIHTAKTPCAVRQLSKDEGSSLIKYAVTARERRLPSFGVEAYESQDDPSFYFFTAVWAGEPNGSVVIGNFAVDRATGDVFSATMSCDEIRNTKLRTAQSKLRSEIGMSRSEYQTRKTTGPLCDR
jgi:hypothetical protein